MIFDDNKNGNNHNKKNKIKASSSWFSRITNPIINFLFVENATVVEEKKEISKNNLIDVEHVDDEHVMKCLSERLF
jgi:hypothetical protein